MKFLAAWVSIIMTVAPTGAEPQVPADRLVAARSELTRLIAASGAEVAVVWRPLDDAGGLPGVELLINANAQFHAASTMKVPVMMELFRQVESGRLRLDDLMMVTNQFHSIVDGSQYELSATEDSDG